MDGPPLSKNVRIMTIKKLYTNLCTFVDNSVKLRAVYKKRMIYSCRKTVLKHNIKFYKGYQQEDKVLTKLFTGDNFLPLKVIHILIKYSA